MAAPIREGTVAVKRQNAHLRRGCGRRGFTLAEVIVSAALLAIGFTALVASFGHESVVIQRGEDITLATFLAEEIRDKAFQMAFADALDLDGTTYSPASLSTGVSEDLSNWSQRISVTPVSSSDLNEEVEAAEAQAARLTVEVFAGGNPVLTQTYYIFDFAGVPFTEDGEGGDDDDDDDDDDDGDG